MSQGGGGHGEAAGEADAAEPIELEQRALVTMPGGWKMSQLEIQ